MSCRTSNIDDEFIRSAGGGATSQNKTPQHRPRASGANQPHMQTTHHHRCAVDATTKQGRGIPVGNVSAAAILRACVLQAKLVHSTGGGRNNNRCSSPSHNIYNNTHPTNTGRRRRFIPRPSPHIQVRTSKQFKKSFYCNSRQNICDAADRKRPAIKQTISRQGPQENITKLR